VFGFAFALFQKPREYLLSLSSAICELDDRYESWERAMPTVSI
jgi:hypothetical protein